MATCVALRSSVSATGQACQSLERVYVDRQIAQAFIDRICALAEKETINYPNKDEGFIGPFIFEKQADIVAGHLRDAEAKGATSRVGGEIIEHGGKWLHATVVTDVNHEMKVMKEETFGPVAPLFRFKS